MGIAVWGSHCGGRRGGRGGGGSGGSSRLVLRVFLRLLIGRRLMWFLDVVIDVVLVRYLLVHEITVV